MASFESIVRWARAPLLSACIVSAACGGRGGPRGPLPEAAPAVAPDGCGVADIRARFAALSGEGRLDRATSELAAAIRRCPSAAAALRPALLDAELDLGRFKDARATAEAIGTASARATASAAHPPIDAAALFVKAALDDGGSWDTVKLTPDRRGLALFVNHEVCSFVRSPAGVVARPYCSQEAGRVNPDEAPPVAALTAAKDRWEPLTLPGNVRAFSSKKRPGARIVIAPLEKGAWAAWLPDGRIGIVGDVASGEAAARALLGCAFGAVVAPYLVCEERDRVSGEVARLVREEAV